MLRCSGVEVFRVFLRCLGCLGCLGMFGMFRGCSGLLTFLKVRRVTREGTPNWGKIATFGATSLAKKVLQTAEKVGPAQN